MDYIKTLANQVNEVLNTIEITDERQVSNAIEQCMENLIETTDVNYFDLCMYHGRNDLQLSQFQMLKRLIKVIFTPDNVISSAIADNKFTVTSPSDGGGVEVFYRGSHYRINAEITYSSLESLDHNDLTLIDIFCTLYEKDKEGTMTLDENLLYTDFISNIFHSEIKTFYKFDQGQIVTKVFGYVNTKPTGNTHLVNLYNYLNGVRKKISKELENKSN